MTTRVLSFLEILAQRGSIAKTTAAPNSWAAVSWWRKFFEQKEQEEEERLDEIAEILQSEIRKTNPIQAAEVVAIREGFRTEPYRNLRESQRTNIMQSSSARSAEPTPSHVLERPNLNIPAGEEYRYLAQ